MTNYLTMYDAEYPPVNTVPANTVWAGYLTSSAAGHVWGSQAFAALTSQGISTAGIYFMPANCGGVKYTPDDWGQAITFLDVEEGGFPEAQNFVDANPQFPVYMNYNYVYNVVCRTPARKLWLACPCSLQEAQSLVGTQVNGWTVCGVQYAFDVSYCGTNTDISIMDESIFAREDIIMDHSTAFGIAHSWYGLLGRGASVGEPDVEGWTQRIMAQGLDVAFQQFIDCPEPLTAQNLLNPLVHTDQITPLQKQIATIASLQSRQSANLQTIKNALTSLSGAVTVEQVVEAIIKGL